MSDTLKVVRRGRVQSSWRFLCDGFAFEFGQRKKRNITCSSRQRTRDRKKLLSRQAEKHADDLLTLFQDCGSIDHRFQSYDTAKTGRLTDVFAVRTQSFTTFSSLLTSDDSSSASGTSFRSQTSSQSTERADSSDDDEQFGDPMIDDYGGALREWSNNLAEAEHVNRELSESLHDKEAALAAREAEIYAREQALQALEGKPHHDPAKDQIRPITAVMFASHKPRRRPRPWSDLDNLAHVPVQRQIYLESVAQVIGHDRTMELLNRNIKPDM